MILRPLIPAPLAASAVIPAWQAVAASQQQSAAGWWLIAQPDHAALAGDLAARFKTTGFPPLEADVVQAITLHDAGWAKYDGGGQAGGGAGAAPQPLRGASGDPLSFLQAPVGVFVEAWTASIQCAEEQTGPTGGLMVSGHFRRLAQHRLDSVEDSPADAACVREFLRDQTQQDQARRFRYQQRSQAELERLIDLLQFCDLLSLYLCCGSRAAVQFPQNLGESPVVLRSDGEVCLLSPSPFCEEISLGVPARREPGSHQGPSVCVLPVLLR